MGQHRRASGRRVGSSKALHPANFDQDTNDYFQNFRKDPGGHAKHEPDASDDEVWRMAFLVFMRDEMNKTLQRLEKQVLDAAINEQV